MAEHPLRLTLERTLVVLGVVLFALALWYAHLVFLLLFTGLLFGIFIRAIANWICRHLHFSMNWALTITILTLLIVVVVVVASLAPGISEQVRALRRALPQSLDELRNYLKHYSWGADLIDSVPTVNDITSSDTSSILYNLTGAISRTFEVVINIAVVIFTGIFIASEPELYIDGFLKLWPAEAQPKIRRVLHEIHMTLQGWLLGTLADMALISILTLIALEIIGIPLALTLALLTGLLNFIPNIGAIASAILPTLLGLMQSPGTALTVILAYFGIQFLESHIATPLIQKHTSSVPPILAITAQLTFGILFGFMGLLLAVPMMAVLIVLVSRFWIHRNEDLDAPAATV